MDAIRQNPGSVEIKGVIDCGNGIPILDRSSYGPQEPNLMDNLYSILTLSLVFYERITKPFDGRSDEGILVDSRGPGIGS